MVSAANAIQLSSSNSADPPIDIPTPAGYSVPARRRLLAQPSTTIEPLSVSLSLLGPANCVIVSGPCDCTLVPISGATVQLVASQYATLSSTTLDNTDGGDYEGSLGVPIQGQLAASNAILCVNAIQVATKICTGIAYLEVGDEVAAAKSVETTASCLCSYVVQSATKGNALAGYICKLPDLANALDITQAACNVASFANQLGGCNAFNGAYDGLGPVVVTVLADGFSDNIFTIPATSTGTGGALYLGAISLTLEDDRYGHFNTVVCATAGLKMHCVAYHVGVPFLVQH